MELLLDNVERICWKGLMAFDTGEALAVIVFVIECDIGSNDLLFTDSTSYQSTSGNRSLGTCTSWTERLIILGKERSIKLYTTTWSS